MQCDGTKSPPCQKLMGPNVQSGKTRWDQTSSLAKMAWDQMSMGPIVWLPFKQFI